MRRRGAPGPAPWGGRRRPPSSGRAAATGRVRRLRHPGAGRRRPRRRPLPDGQLVHGELGVRGHLVLGRGPLAGLEVDDVRPPLGVLLDPVHGATDAYGVLARFEGDVEVVLAGRGGAPGAVHDVPAQEAFQGGPGVVLLLLRLPGASKTRPSHTESSRSIRTSRSAAVRPEATSSASTWTTLPKPWAAVAGASAFTSRPRNHWRAQVLASWSSALPERATGRSLSRSGTSERVGSFSPTSGAGGPPARAAGPRRR